MRWNRRRMRQLEGELIHHSCRGSQYVSIGYTERLAEAGIEPFVGSVGDSYDSVGRDNQWTLQGRGDPPTFMAQTASSWNWPRSTGCTGSITGHVTPAAAAAAYPATNRSGRPGLNQPKPPPSTSERLRLRHKFGTVMELTHYGCNMKPNLTF